VTAPLPPRAQAEADLQATIPAPAETIAIPEQQTESPILGESGSGDREAVLAAPATGSRRGRRTTWLLGAVGVFTVLALIPATRPVGAVVLLVVLFPLSGIFWLLTRKATDGTRTRAIIATVASFVAAMIGGSLMAPPPPPTPPPAATAPAATDTSAAPDSQAAPAAAVPALPVAPNPLLAPIPHQIAPMGARSAAFKTLVGGLSHYRDLLAQGQQIIGNSQYPDGMTGLAAMEDPGSAAARFRDWRQSSDAERDLSYLASFTDADHNFTAETEPQAIGDWRDDMGQVQDDISQWISVAVNYQISTATQADLDNAAAAVQADMDKAMSDARGVQRG
jgi:hypothetical protein